MAKSKPGMAKSMPKSIPSAGKPNPPMRPGSKGKKGKGC